MFTLLDQDEEDFLRRLVTMDESWVYHYDPETRTTSMEWKHVDFPPPKKAKVQKSAGNVMLTVFWDCHGVILTDYHPKRQTFTGTYYSNLMDKLWVTLKNKRHGILSRSIRLLADNAPAHSSQDAVDKVRACGFEILQHPPYSPNLTPSEFFLFPEIKNPLRVCQFDNTDIINEVEEWFYAQSADFYNNCIHSVKKTLGKMSRSGWWLRRK